MDKTDGNYIVVFVLPTIFHQDERFALMRDALTNVFREFCEHLPHFGVMDNTTPLDMKRRSQPRRPGPDDHTS